MEEPSTKRLKQEEQDNNKTENGDILFLSDLPDSLIEKVLSFAKDFEVLLVIRQASIRLKSIVGEILKRRALETLPFNCYWGDGSGEREAGASLSIGWSEKFRNRNTVYEMALTHARRQDNYEENRAQELIRSRGWVDFTDFLVNSNEEDSDDERCGNGNYSDEIGWRVRASLRTVSLQNAWRVAKQIFTIDDEDSTTDDKERTVARQYVFSLLLTAQPSRIQHAYVQYDFRNPDYPAGGKERALLFLTADGKQIQLSGSFNFITC